jgi:hypothetical protein
MRPKALKVSKEMKPDDFINLSYLYLYRALDINQMYKYVYHLDLEAPDFSLKSEAIRKRLINLGLIKISVYLPNKEAVQITNVGIEIVRFLRDIPQEIWDNKTKIAKKGYYTAADLAMNTRLMNHQIHLNQFMLEFEDRARKLKIPWNYYDEKFLSQYVGMRPDGMITILDNDLFIEIDMATESKKQLEEKWDHYRIFMQSNEYKYKSRKIIVLFDIDNILSKRKIGNRIDMVKTTLKNKLLDEITGDFEIVINTKDELLNYLFDEFIPRIFQENLSENKVLNYLKSRGYSNSFGYALNNTLQGDFYNYYSRKINKDGKINKRHNVVDEFFIDFYYNNEMSVLHRLDWFQKNSKLYKERYGRGINLIIVTKDITSLYNDLSILDMRVLGQPGVFFISLDDLNEKVDVWSNLKQFSLDGAVYKIVTDDLSRREFLFRIDEKKIRHKVGKVV